MANISTKYLGLNLKNPIIVSSSGLTSSVSKIIELEKYGAGAVVLKSLFEEQITHEVISMASSAEHTEALDYIKNYIKLKSVDEYLKLISDAKKSVKIPVIASICCTTSTGWTEFAQKIEQAGADSLEVNLFHIPTNKSKDGLTFENLYTATADRICKSIKIPVAIKLGYHFSNIPGIVETLNAHGISGVVLFNRFYEPDIDIEKLEFRAAEIFSSPSDIRQSLRWIGIVSGIVPKIDISASTGIHDSKAIIKMLLAGASSTQICSVLYRSGLSIIPTMLKDLEIWMDRKNYKTIDEFKGKMSYKNIISPDIYERSQFMKYFSNVE